MAPTYPPFDCQADGKAVRWNKYTDRLSNLFVGYDIADSNRKKALLLTYAGDELNDIVDTIPAEELEAGEDEDVYDKLVKAVKKLFNPSTNIEFQRYQFRNTKQKSDNITEFYNKLKCLAATCNFGERTEEEIKSQLISGCKHTKVRQKGLSDSTVTLAKLLEFARTLELTEAQSRAIEGNSATTNNVTRSSRNNIRTRHTSRPAPRDHERFQESHSAKQQVGKQQCRNCGGSWPHHGGQKRCPAFGKSCSKCNKVNHFAKVCLSSAKSFSTTVVESENKDVSATTAAK